MGKVSLENQGIRRGRGATISPDVGKPCHDLPSRLEALPQSPLAFRTASEPQTSGRHSSSVGDGRPLSIIGRPLRRSTAEEYRSTVATVDRKVEAVDRWQILRCYLFPQSDKLL